MQQLIKGTVIAATCLLTAASVSAADDSGNEFYRASEFSIDAFGTGSIGQQTINNLSGSRISSDVRLGAGIGMNYFFTRNLGVGGDVYSESLSGSFIDSAALNITGRFPIGSSGLAPYIFGGGGHQFDRIEQWYAHLGAGVEIRFHSNWGIFIDARYVLADKSANYGVGRVGVRYSF
jgi:outer membrane protein W